MIVNSSGHLDLPLGPNLGDLRTNSVHRSIERFDVAIEPTWLRQGKIPALDFLRAVAVLLVLTNHAFQTAGAPDWLPLKLFAYHASFGVDIFFVISGFLITTLLLRELDADGSVNLKRFYLRRSLRILPAYLCLLVVIAIAQATGYFQLEVRDWWGALTYTSNFLFRPSWELVHCWSLSVEEHFYLIWPFVLSIGGAKVGLRLCLNCIAICWVVRCSIAFGLLKVLFPSSPFWENQAQCELLAQTWTLTRLDTIAMGCLLALLSRLSSGRAFLDRAANAETVPRYLALLAISLVLTLSSTYQLCIAYSLNAVCIALIVWGAVRARNSMRAVLENRLFSVIGVGSYSIYLWQQLFLHPNHAGWAHQFPQNILLALCAAAASFWLIERPIVRWKQRIG